MKKWFFIASPKTHNAEWKDVYADDWGKPEPEGFPAWGIPDGSKDIDKLNLVRKDDIILCYVAGETKLKGQCVCEGTYDNDSVHGFSHGIYIRNFQEYVKYIKLSELRKKGFNFITDFLGNNNGRGRSIVEINNDDWDKFKKIYYPRTCIVHKNEIKKQKRIAQHQ